MRALRYQSIFRQLDAQVRIAVQVSGSYDIAVIINAVKCATAVAESNKTRPQSPIIVVVTGTDLYRFGNSEAFHHSLRVADRVVVSQPTMLDDLPKEFRTKGSVIFQSAKAVSVPRPSRRRHLRAIVCGHLRPEKDPFRTAIAARSLPDASKILIDHYGAALSESFAQRARAEMKRSDRYRWHGQVTHGRVRRKIATAWLMVLSSKMEGGANVLSEAIAAGTPVLASRIAGTIGLLGADYPGYFEVADTKHLRELLLRCETDEAFYRSLARGVASRSHLVTLHREQAAWKDLLQSL